MARLVTNALCTVDILNHNRDHIPVAVAFHFISTSHPDGNAADTRLNANNVDPDRKWDTSDRTGDLETDGLVRGVNTVRHKEV